MTLKEITALRKAGEPEKALRASEAEFSREPGFYTASSLFWCLNDIIKREKGDESRATFERMKTLMQDYCPADELMQKTLLHTERLVTPHYKEMRDAAKDAKLNGNAISHYLRMDAIYKTGEITSLLHADFGWLIYYALKETTANDLPLRKSMLNQYLQLNLPRPSILHSRILSEAMRAKKESPDDFRLIEFAKLWGLDNFNTDDWSQFKTDKGIVLLSFVEKFIGLYAKEIRARRMKAPDEFCRLTDTAMSKFPGSQNLPYTKAIILVSHGKIEEAIEYYKTLIQKFPSKQYLFDHLASLVDDPDIKTGLLSKYLVSRQSEDFMGGVRLKMARLLIAKGLYENAKYEVERYRQIHIEKKWGFNEEFRNLSEILKDVSAAPDNRHIYKKYIPIADGFLYSSLPTLIAIKASERNIEDRYRPGKKITFWQLQAGNGNFSLKNPAKYGLDWRSPDGTQFYIKVQGDKIVWIRQS